MSLYGVFVAKNNEYGSHYEMLEGHLPSRSPSPKGFQGYKVTRTRDNGDHRPYHLDKLRGRIRRYHARRFDWLNIRADFPQFLRSHRNHSRYERRYDQILSIVKKGLDRR
jgi:hypothetical protein